MGQGERDVARGERGVAQRGVDTAAERRLGGTDDPRGEPAGCVDIDGHVQTIEAAGAAIGAGLDLGGADFQGAVLGCVTIG